MINLLYIQNQIKEYKNINFEKIIEKDNKDFSKLSNPLCFLVPFFISLFLGNLLGVFKLINDREIIDIVMLFWGIPTYFMFKATPSYYKGYRFNNYEKKLKETYPKLANIYEEVFFIKYLKTQKDYVSSFALFLMDLKSFERYEIEELIEQKEIIKKIRNKQSSSDDIDFF